MLKKIKLDMRWSLVWWELISSLCNEINNGKSRKIISMYCLFIPLMQVCSFTWRAWRSFYIVPEKAVQCGEVPLLLPAVGLYEGHAGISSPSWSPSALCKGACVFVLGMSRSLPNAQHGNCWHCEMGKRIL